MDVSNFHRLVDGKKGVRRKPGKTTGKPMMIDGITKTSRPLYFYQFGTLLGYSVDGCEFCTTKRMVIASSILYVRSR